MGKSIRCSSCGAEIKPRWGQNEVKCPICGGVLSVMQEQKRMEMTDSNRINVIRYEAGNDMLVYKHPIQDFTYGTQLIVHESQEAIFFKDGQALDSFGAGRYTLETGSLPILNKTFQIASSQNMFAAEVYFVNLAVQMGIKWGTDSKVRLFDPASGIYIEIGACGNFSIKVSDTRKLVLKLVGTANEFGVSDIIQRSGCETELMVGKFKALIMTKVKSLLARIIREENISILEIDAYIDVISEKMKNAINPTLGEYGLFMPEFFITRIVTPDDDPNYRRLKQQYADRILRVREEDIRKVEAEAARERKRVEAETVAELKAISASGDARALRLKAQAEADAYKMRAYAEADEMRVKGYTYQQETARQVGLEAMQNGITGNGGVGSGLGDLAGIGVGLGAMSGVINMTKEVMSPIMTAGAEMGTDFSDVIAGKTSVTGTAFNNNLWDCACGQKEINSNYCPECGAKRPEVKIPEIWDCTCGEKGISSKFCPECGKKRGE